MTKIISFLILIFLIINQTYSENYYYQFGKPNEFQNKLLTFGDNTCENISEEDIPTIFIPGILASWYSEEGFNESKVKRWIPDPITHSYDTLFYTFKLKGYELKDVFYLDEYNIKIEGNPKHSLYLFGYDWKKDNKITATLLNSLISKIKEDYLSENGCDIGKVNIIAHSMGGLVARAMLEDMCVNDEELENYKNIKKSNGKIMDFLSTKCKDQTKINKLVTISTPHRGSPRSLPLWEKGDISMVEDTLTSLGLKSQFTQNSIFRADDYLPLQKLYERIHGYDDIIPNGMVTIGQLLPDLNNVIESNIKFGYLNKKNVFIPNSSYPKNSFLEELNKTENINKMFEKIEDKYSMYYSIITSNDAKNNITGFNLKPNYYDYDQETAKKIYYEPDITQNNKGNDIYDKYDNYAYNKEYNIENTTRNQKGLGGDGTVPTYNLMLIPNDSLNGKQIQNSKFESIEIKCYDKELIQKNGYSDYRKIENYLYKNFGTNDGMEICSHTKMPIATAVNVFIKISGINIIDEKYENQQLIKERTILLSNLGYADYSQKYLESYKNPCKKSDCSVGIYKIGGIYNTTKLNDFYEMDGVYYPVNSYKDIIKYLDTNVGENDRISLDFGSSKNSIIRYEVLSPINISITDSLGRKIGINPETGMIENEIPGAWTSGNTEGSGEPEFFLIPVTGTGEIEHEIKTYGTGNGEYHIVMEEIDISESNPNLDSNQNPPSENQPSSLPFPKGVPEVRGGGIIKGTAKNNFGDDYLITTVGGKTELENLSENIPTTLEINNTDIETSDSIYKIRYNIRGQSGQVEKIKYVLYKNDEIIIQKDEKINGEIDVELDEEGDYILKIELVNNEGKVFDNIESKKEVKIKKVKKLEDILKSNMDNKNLEKDNYSNENVSFLNTQLLDKLNNNLDKKITLIGKNSYDFEIEFYEDNNNNIVNSNLGYGLVHNFDYKFYYNKNLERIEVILPGGKSNIFEYNKDFEFDAAIENNLSINDNVGQIKIIDSIEDKEYIFDKESFRLLKIINKESEIELFYNFDGSLDYIMDDENNSYFFTYDENNNLLVSISDIFQNKAIFNYLKIGEYFVLQNIQYRQDLFNFNKIDFVINDNYQLEISDNSKSQNIVFGINENEKSQKRLEFELKYRSKLNEIKNRVGSKFSLEQREKMKGIFVNGKDGFLNKINDEYKKMELEYLIDEIIKNF